MGQSGIGWFAPLVAVAGLLMALAGASGWGEQPGQIEFPQSIEPTSESHSHGHPSHDAGPPDAGLHEDNILVGLRS